MLFAVLVLLLAMADSPLRLGLQALERKDFAVAATHLEQAAKATPEEPSVWVLLAQALFRAGNRNAALEAAAKAEETGKDNLEVTHALAFLYAEFALDYAKAAAFEEQYAKGRPTDTGAWQRVASLYMQAGLPERAIEPAVLALAANSTPESRAIVEEAYFRTSEAQLVTRDFEGATKTLEEARKVVKDSPQIELALGVALYGDRKFTRSISQFLRTMELAPDIEQPYVFAGKILEHAGPHMPTLLQRFTAYQRSYPESYLGYLLAAKALVTQGVEGDQPLELVRQAIAKKADDPESQFLLGTLLEARGELADAAKALERSAALRSGDTATHYRLARLYLKLGRKQDAAQHRAMYEKLAEENPAVP